MNKRGFTLIEVVVVIAIMGILLGLAVPPFLEMLKKSTVEESAQRIQEAIKSAQIEAQKRGDTEFGNFSSSLGKNQISGQRRKVYLALYPTTRMIRTLSWEDRNVDGLKTTNEFTLLQETTLRNGTDFNLPASITKVGCSNTPRTSSETYDGIVNFTASVCPPTTVSLFPDGTRCIKINGKGFAESMNNVAVYITGNENTVAVSMSPVGLTELCRWSGSSWVKIR